MHRSQSSTSSSACAAQKNALIGLRSSSPAEQHAVQLAGDVRTEHAGKRDGALVEGGVDRQIVRVRDPPDAQRHLGGNQRVAKKRNYPVHAKFSLKEATYSFGDGFLPLLTPVIILGGILGGIFSPTEAAIVASAWALVLGMVVYKEIRFRDLISIVMETIKTTSMVIYIISAAAIFGWLLGREQVPQSVARLLFSISNDPNVILLIIIIFLLIIGCVMETTAALILLTPILVPPIIQLGIDPVHFGLVMVLDLMIGLLTPPVGVVLYITSSIAKISFEEMSRVTAPYLIPLVIVLLISAFFPAVTMTLPNLLIR